MSVSTAGPPTLDQLALAAFIEGGELDRHLRSMRKRYRLRRDALVAALMTELPACRLSGIAAGLHLLLSLPAGADDYRTDAAPPPASLPAAPSSGRRQQVALCRRGGCSDQHLVAGDAQAGCDEVACCPAERRS